MKHCILDPKRKLAEFFVRDEQVKYQPVTTDSEGIYHSVVLSGLWIKADWLWQNPKPTLVEVLKAWGTI